MSDTPRTDNELAWRDGECVTDALTRHANFARQLEREVIRLSAEREKDGLVANRDVPTLFPTLQHEIESLRATLAERYKELAEERALRARSDGFRETLAAKHKAVKEDRDAILDHRDRIAAQLLAAQTVNGELREAITDIVGHTMALAHGEPESCVWQAINHAGQLLNSSSPDPTLLDEVKREKEELEGKLQAVEPVIVELSQRFEHRPSPDDTWKECLCGQCRLIRSARTALSRLRQSTRETEEKV